MKCSRLPIELFLALLGLGLVTVSGQAPSGKALPKSLRPRVLGPNRRNTEAGASTLAGADFKTKAGDDFFRYANGGWLDRVQIPADKPAYSLRLAMTDTIEQRLRELLVGAAAKAGHEPTTTAGKVGAFYKSFMNEAAVEKAGAGPLKDQIAEICGAGKTARDWQH